MTGTPQEHSTNIFALLLSAATILPPVTGGCPNQADREPSIFAATTTTKCTRQKGRVHRSPTMQPSLPVKRGVEANADSRPTAETVGQRLLRKGYFESRSGALNGGH